MNVYHWRALFDDNATGVVGRFREAAVAEENAMNLYLLSQDANTGYDTYDSCVVAAVDHVTAARISPDNCHVYSVEQQSWMFSYADGRTEKDSNHAWVDDISLIKVEQIGIACEGVQQGVICASFNAG